MAVAHKADSQASDCHNEFDNSERFLFSKMRGVRGLGRLPPSNSRSTHLATRPAAAGKGCGALQDFKHPVGVEQFRQYGYRMVDMVCDYYSGMEDAHRVVPDVKVCRGSGLVVGSRCMHGVFSHILLYSCMHARPRLLHACSTLHASTQ